MGRFLTMMLIVCLAFSHGRVGAVIPHADGSDHEAYEQVQFMDHDHHASNQTADDETGTTKSDKADKKLGHHVHSAADGIPLSTPAIAVRDYKEIVGLPTNDPALRLIALESISEPPSA